MDERFDDPVDDEQSTQSPETDTEDSADADEPLNIREDWDSATIYIEPDQSEEMEVMFARLKKQLKRDGYNLEKNKHFYRAVFELAFEDYREETKEKIRELAAKDTEN